ncbi:hypothetical protein DOX53_03285 [Cronobacter malonaticus]|uniref:Uncharacterized protein n=2 Tax=Cronobacter malonaticus TaxID=413503 RepID=A0A423Y372_9ENTR|nr:hypothetical protein [Cronobacter malonaticus]CCJ97709.1 FIG00554597: hypothetical protein [Cronobacter malonaticus 507]EGT4287563.1 hypothetical protein [Cronobacter malonaticus]EGT4295304.1 hypothetical protein [Cronobacter malonaticus]EGT4312264.1 hypothetical protein [Cronobacter malonaticus]
MVYVPAIGGGINNGRHHIAITVNLHPYILRYIFHTLSMISLQTGVAARKAQNFGRSQKNVTIRAVKGLRLQLMEFS